MSTVALAAILLILAGVPLGLALLGASSFAARWPVVGRLAGSWPGRVVLVLLAVPALVGLGRAVWGWSGAAHLQPLCIAYAYPEKLREIPVVADSVLIDVDAGPAPAATEPEWAAGLLAGTRALAFYEVRGSGDTLRRVARTGIVATAAGTEPASPVVLEVRRSLHHANRWFRVEMDRFTLRSRVDGDTLALGDELWIRAGRAEYRCGIASGTTPARGSGYPRGDGVLRFIRSVAVPSDGT